MSPLEKMYAAEMMMKMAEKMDDKRSFRTGCENYAIAAWGNHDRLEPHEGDELLRSFREDGEVFWHKLSRCFTDKRSSL